MADLSFIRKRGGKKEEFRLLIPRNDLSAPDTTSFACPEIDGRRVSQEQDGHAIRRVTGIISKDVRASGFSPGGKIVRTSIAELGLSKDCPSPAVKASKAQLAFAERVPFTCEIKGRVTGRRVVSHIDREQV